jgi:general secretion pathway protein H
MPISAPGSKRSLHGSLQAQRRGFTLLELLLVLAIVAISAGLAVLALRDSNAAVLEREAVRLAALLEMARAESRVAGTPVRWVPGSAPEFPGQMATEGNTPKGFHFPGLGKINPLPERWLDDRVTAQVPPPGWLALGPDAILPRQRVLLRLADQQIEISSDGLGPFNVGALPEAAPP